MNPLLLTDLRDLPEALDRALGTAQANRPGHRNDRIVVTGSGDSLFGARALAGPFRSRGIELLPQYPLAIAAQQALPSDRTLVAISFSGTAQRTVAAAERAAADGLHVIAVTSETGSPLADIANEVVPIDWSSHSRELPHCADHVATMAALVATIEGLAGLEFNLSALDAFDDASSAAAETARSVSSRVTQASWIHFLAAGEEFAIAQYAAAKLWESQGQRATAFELEEYGHGPHMMTDVQDAVVILATDDRVTDAVHSARDWVSQIGAKFVDIPSILPHTSGDDAVARPFFDQLPAQWLTYWLADCRAVDVVSGGERLQAAGR